jgi:2-polyprenyl-3-methyl-5-hydroxy-6-metoxy-1,4-benzoquinol methylase
MGDFCRLCGSNNNKLLYRKETFNIIECQNCGFIFSDKWEKFSDKAAVVQESPARVEQVKEAFDRDKNVYFDRFKNDIKYLTGSKETGKVLDVGCGFVYFLALMKKSGWETHGTDIDEAAVEFCRKHLSIDVKCGELKENEYPGGFFDAITLYNVLEHIPDFQGTMGIVKKILKPGGTLIINVPNAGDLRRFFLGQNWAHFREHHIWYFSKKSIVFLLKKYGFTIEMIRYHGGSELVYTAERVFKIKAGGFISRHFKILRPIKNILGKILNFIGFNEDMLIYAKNTDN